MQSAAAMCGRTSSTAPRYSTGPSATHRSIVATDRRPVLGSGRADQAELGFRITLPDEPRRLDELDHTLVAQHPGDQGEAWPVEVVAFGLILRIEQVEVFPAGQQGR